MTWFDSLLAYLGTAKYAAGSVCLTSDYVLVRMFTILRMTTGTCAVLISILLYFCYRDGNNMLRLSVLILKDVWMIKLLALFMMFVALNQFVGSLTLHYAVYNLQAFTLTGMASISVYTLVRLCSIAFDKSRQTSILEEVLTDWSGDIPNYGHEPVEGQHVVAKPLPIKVSDQTKKE